MTLVMIFSTTFMMTFSVIGFRLQRPRKSYLHLIHLNTSYCTICFYSSVPSPCGLQNSRIVILSGRSALFFPLYLPSCRGSSTLLSAGEDITLLSYHRQQKMRAYHCILFVFRTNSHVTADEEPSRQITACDQTTFYKSALQSGRRCYRRHVIVYSENTLNLGQIAL